jgi:hypothetical protein
LPEPTPKKVRPGASRAIVAMPWAMTGAMRRSGTATPVPMRMVRVCWAASASEACTSERTMGESVIHACE